jgi:tetratricopeptide (TPR) repeat protein
VREAIATCEALLAKAEAPVWASFVLPFLGALRSMSGLFDEARSDLEAARVARAEFAAPGTLATSWATLAAEVELRAEAPGRAAEILTEAVPSLRAAGDAEWLAMNGAHLAEAELWLGHTELALSHADAALAAAPPSHLSSCARAKRVRAQALTRLGRTDEGLALAEEVVIDLAETDALVERAEAFAAHAEALALAGAHDAAALRRDEAIAEFERKGDVVSAARVRRLAVC